MPVSVLWIGLSLLLPLLNSYRKGTTLVAESPFIAAVVMKALKVKDVDDELLLEVYEFISIYCSLMGPLISFSDEETDFLLTHLCGHVQQIEKTTIVLQQSHVAKGKNKRIRADLNVDTSDKPQVSAAVHAAALQAITALLVTDPRAVTEEKFTSLAHSVANEALRVNACRYNISEDCVYAEAGNRKLLYKLLELVAKYPVHAKHRPLHIALHVFAEAAAWDIRDTDFSIPSFCRNALLTLDLITDPVIAPLVRQHEHVSNLISSESISSPAAGNEDIGDRNNGQEGEETEETAVPPDDVDGDGRSGSAVLSLVTDGDVRDIAVSASDPNALPATSEQDEVRVLGKSTCTRSGDDEMETTITASSSATERMMDTITISDDSEDETVAVSNHSKNLPAKTDLIDKSVESRPVPDPVVEQSHHISREEELHVTRGCQYTGSVFDEPDPRATEQVSGDLMEHEFAGQSNADGCIDDILAAGDFEY